MSGLFKYLSGSFCMICLCATSQTDFFKLYKQIDDKYNRLDVAVPTRADLTVADSVEIDALQKKHTQFYEDSVIPLLKNVHNLSFPDINFIDAANKDRTLSDYSNYDVIINYTYLYCTTCINRIDSTLKRIDPRKTKMIVLVSETYVKELPDLQRFGPNVITGFINRENIDLISLKQGDDCMYYLDKNRQIEYFDKSVYPRKQQYAGWLTFLDNRLK